MVDWKEFPAGKHLGSADPAYKDLEDRLWEQLFPDSDEFTESAGLCKSENARSILALWEW